MFIKCHEIKKIHLQIASFVHPTVQKSKSLIVIKDNETQQMIDIFCLEATETTH